MKPELQIIFKIWDLDEEWEKLADPRFNWYGNMTYRNPSDTELFRMIAIQNEIKSLNKELLKKVGFWNYIKYKLSPLRFVKRFTIK